MLSVVIAFVFGAFEAYVLSKLLAAAISGDYKNIIKYFFIKFVSYAAMFFILFFFFPQYILNCVIGYFIGLPVVTVIWFIRKTLKDKKAQSGDDKNENSNNN